MGTAVLIIYAVVFVCMVGYILFLQDEVSHAVEVSRRCIEGIALGLVEVDVETETETKESAVVLRRADNGRELGRWEM